MPGFSPLSPTTIASFITAFGGVGMILSAWRDPFGVDQCALGYPGGLLVACLVFWLFRTVFRRTQGSSESKVAQLVGAPATVITPISSDGVGEIAYVQSGSRYTAPARVKRAPPSPMGRLSSSRGLSHDFLRGRGLTDSLLWHETHGMCTVLTNKERTPMSNIPLLAIIPQEFGWMALVIVSIVFVIFVFGAVWASRYTKVGPNEVLVVSGRQYRVTDPDGVVRTRGFRIVKAVAHSSCL